jgi:outer membrane protein assembly factor BamB
MDGKFYCFNAKTGDERWTFLTGAEIDCGANFFQDKVLVGSQDATLYCLDSATGKLVWKFTIGDQIRCTPTVVDRYRDRSAHGSHSGRPG